MIGFAGLSHLGLVSSLATASKGFEVMAYHPDADLCARLTAADLPLFEPGLAELLRDNRDRIRFTADPADLRQCELVYLSIDMPSGEDDCSALHDLADDVLNHASPTAVLVLLSQVRPGYTRRWFEALRQSGHHPKGRLFYQVETLIFGQAVSRATQPARIIVGCDDPGAGLPKVFDTILSAFSCPVLRMRYESAELAKIAINVFLASTISATNTLAELCEVTGADWSEIAPALRLDARIGPDAYLDPGLGISGGNLERDLRGSATGRLFRHRCHACRCLPGEFRPPPQLALESPSCRGFRPAPQSGRGCLGPFVQAAHLLGQEFAQLGPGANPGTLAGAGLRSRGPAR